MNKRYFYKNGFFIVNSEEEALKYSSENYLELTESEYIKLLNTELQEFTFFHPENPLDENGEPIIVKTISENEYKRLKAIRNKQDRKSFIERWFEKYDEISIKYARAKRLAEKNQSEIIFNYDICELDNQAMAYSKELKDIILD